MKQSLRLMLRILVAGLSVGIVLTACNDGGSTSGAAVAPQSYNGPGSKWNVALDANGSFDIDRRPDHTSPIDLTVSGNYERLSSGFLKFTVAAATGVDAPAPGDEAWGLEIEGYTILLKPMTSSNDQLIPMVSSGQCPVTDIDANWVIVKKSSASIATDASNEYFGSFNLVSATQATSLPARFALANNYQNNGGFALGTGTCADGIMSVSDGLMYLTNNGGAIVHTGLSTPNDASFIFALKEKPIVSAAAFDGDYAGMMFDQAASAGSKIQPVSLSCASGLCSGNLVADVTSGTLSATTVSISLTGTPDALGVGFVTGIVTQGASNGNLACMVDVDAVGSGNRIMSCVGQSAIDNDLLFNLILVSR